MLIGRSEIDLQHAIRLLGRLCGTLIFLEIVGRIVLGFNQTKDEQFVFDDRATGIEVGAQRRLCVSLLEQGVPCARSLRLVIPHVLPLGAQRLRLPVHRDATLPFVGATLGDKAYHTTERATILGTIAAGFDLLLANRIEWQVRVRQEVADVGDIVAVDVVAIFRHRSAAERWQAAIAQTAIAFDDARCQQCNRVHISWNWQSLHLLRRKYCIGLHACHIDG